VRIYPDTSFLVSWLYRGDKHNRKARAWFSRHQNEDWILSDWSRFETINSLRSLCLHKPGPHLELAEALRRYLNHLLHHGPFESERVDWQEVLRDANQISSAFASRMRARSADTLHLAILEQLNPDIFITGDQDQLALATVRGFRAVSFI
jgi:predicted nucleic acid-binding protein